MSETTAEPESETTAEPEPETTTEPEPETTTEPESETTAEPESETTAEPESEATAEPEPETTAEPESETTAEPESETTAEPESETTTEPEPETTAEPESEITAEPESETTVEPEPETTAEPESEATAEPESEGTVEPESEGTAEPESEGTAEPESEGTAEPESEGTAEPESEGTSEPESEGTAEPESEGTAEPESEGTAEPESEVTGLQYPEAEITLIPFAELTTPEAEAEAEAQSEPSVSEIMWPPMILLALGAFVFLILYLLWQRRRVKFKRPTQKNFQPSTFVYEYKDFVDSDPSNLPAFLTDRDTYAIDKLRYFQNNGLSLLYMVTPPALTLLFCPMTLFMYSPITDYFWPKPYFKSPPNVNDSLSCFLVPSGMVYAIMFGFAFQEVFEKHTNIDVKLKGQTLSMKKLVLLLESMESISPRTFLHVLHTLKDEIINIIYRIQTMEDLCVPVNIWGLLKPLNSDQRSKQSPVDQIVFAEVLQCLHDLNVMSAESGCVTEHMHIFQWIFLETLGYFSFLGVLLIQADSYRMELAMCIVTVVSITLLCCVVSDLDFPFHGFFLIDLQMMIDLIDFLHNKSKDVETRIGTRKVTANTDVS